MRESHRGSTDSVRTSRFQAHVLPLDLKGIDLTPLSGRQIICLNCDDSAILWAFLLQIVENRALPVPNGTATLTG